jgi:sulfate permease, SulP family
MKNRWKQLRYHSERLLQEDGSMFLQPREIFNKYKLEWLRPDILAGLTVTIVLLPQAIAYAMIAELPPQTGLYAAIVAAIIGSLWGSSKHLHTGPTNAASLLTLGILLQVVEPGTPEFITAAGCLAVLVGVIRLALGLAKLGVLVNFVADSVVIGFTAGAGVLIGAGQLRNLLKLDYQSTTAFMENIQNLFHHIPESHLPSLFLGLATLALIILLRMIIPKLPAPFIGMVVAATTVAVFNLDESGVRVLGQLPRSFPPLTSLPLWDMSLLGKLSTGALAIAAIGLVEAMSIARTIATQNGQRLNSNQEFVGQGLANIATGFLGGYPVSGSFTRSVVNQKAGGVTQLSGLFSGVWILIAVLLLGPLARFLPLTSLAAVLLVTAWNMVDKKEMIRIAKSSRGDSVIMFSTLGATLILPLEFAVLFGMLVSFSRHLLKTSTPDVHEVVPDEHFHHLIKVRYKRQLCPQMGIIEIEGSLYFGAVAHVEEQIHNILNRSPGHVFLLMRMHRVNHIDVSGVHMLEAIVKRMRDKGGDVYFDGIRSRALHMMSVSGFMKFLGHKNILRKEDPIGFMFHKVLHPGICIYECEKRIFAECQALPKHDESADYNTIARIAEIPVHEVPVAAINKLIEDSFESIHLLDVGETREFNPCHVSGALNLPLPMLTSSSNLIDNNKQIVLISRVGRRAILASHILHDMGYDNLIVMQGGMLAWQAAGYPVAVN